MIYIVYAHLSSVLVALYALVQVIAALFALRAIRTARTPQGAIGWVVFLIAAPHFAVPVFLFLGHRRYPGYVAARRAMAGIVDTLRAQAANHAPRPPAGDPGVERSRIAGFERLAEVPLVSGNGTKLLIDGEQTFDALFAAIEAAEHYVLVEAYIIRDDAVGQALAARLKAKARAGLRVCLLYDALGSNGLPNSYLDSLRAEGVEAYNSHALRHTRSRLQINFRNHRKIAVIDGQTGFVGGLNFGEEYLGRDPNMGPWRDTHLRIDGPAVAQLQLAFAEDWLWASGAKLDDLDWAPRVAPGDRNALVLATGPSDLFETGSLYFCNAIEAARERIWIASPYFVPDADILTALKLAALRGVDVRLLVPEKADHLLVWLAAYAYFDEVRTAGVRLYRYAPGFLHQKVLLVDDDMASVGTHNLDNRSCRLNFEISALIFDKAFAEEVAAMLQRDLGAAPEFTARLSEQGLWIRTAAPVARLFAPVL
ncbi:cardiolipin synthase [Acidimangrovimonas pyrenivorans]|uniref:Cardiolipin synthase n=1 Tax=Acidimangrovimonas pyrenivorans TaxID=2030798 RepID=A0ABV7AHV9_9RHOB